MRKGVALGAVLAVVFTACGGSAGSSSSSAASDGPAAGQSTTSTTAPGFTVVSDDGAFEVRVPVEAMAADPGISIRVLAPDEYPAELAGAAQNPNTRIYNLEPEGLVFDAPVRVIRRIPIENFGELADNEVPVVYLLTQDDAGEYELLDSLYSMRDGTDIVVGGRTTHFSPVIALDGQMRARITTDETHSTFATEVDVDEFFGIEFKASDGTTLNEPLGLEPWGRSRADFIGFGPETTRLQLQCTGVGEAKPRLGFRVTFKADYEEGQAGLDGGPTLLVPGLQQTEMLLKAAPQFRCLDPATSFIGTQYQATLGTDHPGGKPGVPNEDYKGGRSGFYGSLNIKGYVGLVIDYNSNGQVDLDDGMLEPQPIGEDGGFVVGLPSYGSYIPFTVDGASYGTLTSWGPGAYSVYDGLLWLCTLFQGMGRFEASVGALGVGGMEYPYDVDAAETLEDVDGQILQFKVDFRF